MLTYSDMLANFSEGRKQNACSLTLYYRGYKLSLMNKIEYLIMRFLCKRLFA